MNTGRPDSCLIPKLFWLYQQNDGYKNVSTNSFAKSKYTMTAGPFAAKEFGVPLNGVLNPKTDVLDPVVIFSCLLNMYSCTDLRGIDGSPIFSLPRNIQSRDLLMFSYENSPYFGLYVGFHPESMTCTPTAVLADMPNVTTHHKVMIMYPTEAFQDLKDWGP